jgi:hypothetical protein
MADLFPALLLVALKTDQPNIERRLKTILATDEPINPDTEPCVWAKPVVELVAADLDALSVLLGWEAVSRLRVGEVAAGGFSTPPAGAASGDGAGPLAVDRPHATDGSPCWCDPVRDDYRRAE